MWTVEEGIEALRRCGSKITAQRTAILSLLENRTDHPSAEQVFKEIKVEFPAISFATIYSTAQLFEKAGLIQILSVDNKRILLDPNPRPHAHFRCNKCGHLEDVFISEDIIQKLQASSPHDVSDIQLYMYGLCSDCAAGQANGKKLA